MSNESLTFISNPRYDAADVASVREILTTTEKGKPANTIENFQTVFCRDPLLRDSIRLNLLTEQINIVRDLGWHRTTSSLTDIDVKYLLLYFEQNYYLTNEKKLLAALTIVANENCYHPIRDMLNSLKWDGQPRIRLLPASFSWSRGKRLCGGNAQALSVGSNPPGILSRL